MILKTKRKNRLKWVTILMQRMSFKRKNKTENKMKPVEIAKGIVDPKKIARAMQG